MSQAVEIPVEGDRLQFIFSFLRDHTVSHEDEIVALTALIGCMENNMTAEDLDNAIAEFEQRAAAFSILPITLMMSFAIKAALRVWLKYSGSALCSTS